jgi:hypothetical protein
MHYQIWLIAHVTGAVLTFMGLAGVLGMKMAGGDAPKQRGLFFAAHGTGLILLLASGLALVAQL